LRRTGNYFQITGNFRRPTGIVARWALTKGRSGSIDRPSSRVQPSAIPAERRSLLRSGATPWGGGSCRSPRAIGFQRLDQAIVLGTRVENRPSPPMMGRLDAGLCNINHGGQGVSRMPVFKPTRWLRQTPSEGAMDRLINSHCLRTRCRRLKIRHIRTRPYTPKTNGKADKRQ
jgi:hypothetical protein